MTEVFEVYGPTANSRGYDFMVYKSLGETTNALFFDIDALEEGQEVRVILRRYTQEQLDEVIYE